MMATGLEVPFKRPCRVKRAKRPRRCAYRKRAPGARRTADRQAGGRRVRSISSCRPDDWIIHGKEKLSQPIVPPAKIGLNAAAARARGRRAGVVPMSRAARMKHGRPICRNAAARLQTAKLGRNSDGNAACATRTRADRRLLARRQLPVGRSDLSVRQPAAAQAADQGTHQAAAARPLGHDARPQLHLRAPQPAHQRARPRSDLHHRPRPRRPGAGRQRLSRRHLQRGLSRTSRPTKRG